MSASIIVVNSSNSLGFELRLQALEAVSGQGGGTIPSDVLRTTGDQSVFGIKEFKSGIVPNPVLSSGIANKNYIDGLLTNYLTSATASSTYATIANLTATGNTLASQTGSYASSVNLSLTGSNLQTQINTITTWTGNSSSIYYSINNPNGYVTSATAVMTTGNQTIVGNKTFSSNVSITGLSATGFVQRPFVYVGISGNDSNPGTSASPFATVQKALDYLNGEGKIIVLDGDYTGMSVNLANARRVEITAQQSARVRFFNGTRITGFTLYTGNAYRAAAALGPNPTAGTTDQVWIFERDTPAFPISEIERLPLQKDKNYRLEHAIIYSGNPYTLNSITGVTNTGRYFYSGGFLYINPATGGSAVGKEYWLPETGNNSSFCSSGTYNTDISLYGIESYFSTDGFNLKGVYSFNIERCVGYGNYNGGMIVDSAQKGVESFCEFAANGNDGVDATSTSSLFKKYPGISYTVNECWSHDNGDEGHSIHQNMHITYNGGLFENNINGGITPALGAKANMYNVYTRKNNYGITLAIDNTKAFINGWVSDQDRFSFWNESTGKAFIYNSTLIPTSIAITNISAGGECRLVNTKYSTAYTITGFFNKVGVTTCEDLIPLYTGTNIGKFTDLYIQPTGQTVYPDYTMTLINVPLDVTNSARLFKMHGYDTGTLNATQIDFSINSSLAGVLSCSRTFQIASLGNVNLWANNAASRAYLDSVGNFELQKIGGTIKIPEGSNGKMGSGTLSNGSLTVSTTAVNTTSRIFLTPQGSGTGNIGMLEVSSRIAGTSFSVNSRSFSGTIVTTDNRGFAWWIVDPAAAPF